MSRPSRGFSVAKANPSTVVSCPTVITFNFIGTLISDFHFEASWDPAVVFASYSAQISIDGGEFFEFEAGGPADSPKTFRWDLSAIASVGDNIIVDLFLSGSGTCPDFDTVSEQQDITG